MKHAAVLLALLMTSPAHAAPQAWLASETAGMHRINGPFVQRDYGFSVAAPAHASAFVTNGVSGDHSVRVILGYHRKIDIYPQYIEADWGNTEPCGRGQFPSATTGSREAGTILLGTQIACMVTVTGRHAVWSIVQATGADRGQGIMYTMLLTTTRQSIQTDLVALHRLASTFERIPVQP